MNKPDYYACLGVTHNASYSEIKSAYRKLAKQYHPDRVQNPGSADQERFAIIAEAYSVLSDLNRRRVHDASQQVNPRQTQSGPWHTRPHYSGYPYFQWDIFTPTLHTFFMGRKAKSDHNATLRSTFLNGKILFVALLGALMFFKFFSAVNGMVMGKTMDSNLFQNISYQVIIKTAKGKEKKKRIKLQLFDMLKKEDQIEKKFFTFSYRVNGEAVQSVTLARFFLQTAMIYAAISLTLFLLEYGRK